MNYNIAMGISPSVCYPNKFINYTWNIIIIIITHFFIGAFIHFNLHGHKKNLNFPILIRKELARTTAGEEISMNSDSMDNGLQRAEQLPGESIIEMPNEEPGEELVEELEVPGEELVDVSTTKI